MKAAIDISVLGMKYRVYLRMKMGQKECTLQIVGKEEQHPAFIEGNHIVLENPVILSGYELYSSKEIPRIKIPRELKRTVAEYINGRF